METWATDIGNAYLESYTKEKVYIIAGKEFGDREGHILVVSKALYGLRGSAKAWSERLSDALRDMGWVPTKSEPDLWMRKSKIGDHYEYLAVYVDDLAFAVDDPKQLIADLKDPNTFNFKLKGSGPITFHLGMDFYREETGVLCLTQTTSRRW